MGLVSWIKNKTGTILDPQRAHRVAHASRQVEQLLKAQREKFEFDQALLGLDVFPEDKPAIAAATYQLFLERAWSDGVVSVGEQQALSRIAQLLQIDARAFAKLDHAAALRAFRPPCRTV